ncbi:hypothetical protein BQ8482_440016 [Mesorhizobium delmotii]|uniref:Uncharacterized protein n=1 Tax=Mesorhizobium delmotii TaxID=1631247 RepID=A0A2P9ATH8_9HYPH|nr:hypothetical protein BQ8482_440016 [Mesorhizobium delmotii]
MADHTGCRRKSDPAGVGCRVGRNGISAGPIEPHYQITFSRAVHNFLVRCLVVPGSLAFPGAYRPNKNQDGNDHDTYHGQCEPQVLSQDRRRAWRRGRR